MITANQVPDHATIARFRVRHQDAFAGLFTDVLRLCTQAGMVSVGVVAVDGTKMHANASMSANRSYEKITEEILAEAVVADAEEDAQLGDLRGDELPAHLVGRSSRKARLKAAKERLESEVKLAQQAHRERVKERAVLERERGSKLRGRKPKAAARRVVRRRVRTSPTRTPG